MGQDVSREQWDATNYAAKDNLLRVVREEAESFFALAEVPENWQSPTASGHWQVRDIVGHIIDTTEGYIERFDVTRGGGTADGLAPITEMAVTADKRALAFRDSPREELLPRLRDAFSHAMKMFEEVGEEDWGGFMVTHAYYGPLPAWFYPVGQIMDYGVHGWDIREGLGMEHFLSPDVADFLAPIMIANWQYTADVSRLEGRDLDVAVRVTGRNSATFRIKVTSEGMTFEPGSEEGAQVVLDFDPASLVLTAFGRTRTGTPSGDLGAARSFANLFFRV